MNKVCQTCIFKKECGQPEYLTLVYCPDKQSDSRIPLSYTRMQYKPSKWGKLGMGKVGEVRA